jgi:hypothetical protein
MPFTVINGVTKSTTQKSARQLDLVVKEDIADPDCACPDEALKSIVLDIKGENDEGPHGTNTIGQKIEGKIIFYAADANVRTFIHELVTKSVKYMKCTTNSGLTYTFSSPNGVTRPVVTFSYDTANLIAADTKPALITLNVTGYRDNLAIN